MLGALAPYGVLTHVPRPTVTGLYRNLWGTLLTVEHLTADAVDSIEQNLGHVRAYVARPQDACGPSAAE